MTGYANFSMSLLVPSTLNYEPLAVSNIDLMQLGNSTSTVGYCSYFDFRSSSFPYNVTQTFYVVMLARVVCFVIFENIVLIITTLLAQLIPDTPERITRRRRHENLLLQKLLLELERKDRFRRATSTLTRLSSRRLKGIPPDIPEEEAILRKRNGATVFSEAPAATRHFGDADADTRLPPISMRNRLAGHSQNSVRFGLPPDDQLDYASASARPSSENEEQLAVVPVARRNFDGASVQLEPIPQRVMRGRGVLHRLESASTNSQQSAASSPVIVMPLDPRPGPSFSPGHSRSDGRAGEGEGYPVPAFGLATSGIDENADYLNPSPRTSDDDNNIGSSPSIVHAIPPADSFSTD